MARATRSASSAAATALGFAMACPRVCAASCGRHRTLVGRTVDVVMLSAAAAGTHRDRWAGAFIAWRIGSSP
jgi:hypothetical protein